MHHANLIIAQKEVGLKFGRKIIKEAGEYELREYVFQHLRLEDAKTIKKTFAERGQGAGLACLLFANSLGLEAQNSLLKILEDGGSRENRLFFLIAPEEDSLLPTLRSRLNKIAFSEKEANDNFGKIFLQTPKSARLNLPEIKKVIEEKDRLTAKKILESLLRETDELAKKETSIEKIYLLKSLIFKSSQWLKTESVSLKMVFEYLSLVLPVC